MNKHEAPQSSKYLLWPLAVLLFLTIGVFFTSRDSSPKDIRTRAQVDSSLEEESEPLEPVATEMPTEAPPASPTPTPVGTIINLSFSIPGISSEGGNIKPLHPSRDIIFAIYNKDDNTFDDKVKPVLSLKAKATFDDDPQSPTYAQFVLNNFDIGDKIQSGEYQLGLKTTQSLGKVLKKKDTDLHGILYSLDPYYSYTVAFNTLIMGDIVPYPQGDNKIDIADYSTFMDCFGARSETSSCTEKIAADFDDNGVVDGIDYNIMLVGFKSLLALGLPIPTFETSPTPTITPRPTITPPPSNNNGALLGGIFGFLLLVGAGVAAFIYRKKLLPLLRKLKPVTVVGEKEYYIKKKSEDPDKKGLWLTLADDNGQILAHYNKPEVKEGFAKIRGKMKKNKGVSYMEVEEIIWEK